MSAIVRAIVGTHRGLLSTKPWAGPRLTDRRIRARSVGRDSLKGIREASGDRADEILIKEVSYESTDPTIDRQVINLKGAGANIFRHRRGGGSLLLRRFARRGFGVMSTAGPDAKTIMPSQFQMGPPISAKRTTRN